jgi:acyl-CoA synthetase (AMP-forming)/AMP-acid ligase II
MRSLSEKLSTGNANDIIWLSEGAGTVCNGRLSEALAQLPIADWLGKRVALGSLPVLEFVSALVFLDGIADAVLLLPNEEDNETRTRRLNEAKIDCVIENEGLGFAQLLKNQQPPSPITRPDSAMTTWLLPTSGTTGIPKLVPHTLSSLTRSPPTRPLSTAYTWSSIYSLRRFAGLQVFLQSWMSGAPLTLNEEGDDLTTVLARLINTKCSAISATPSMWRKLAMHHLFDSLELKQITLGGEIVDQGILDMLARQFPAARITHIYASTEAGVGFSVKDGKAGFPATYLAKPPGSVAMRIDEQAHLWLRTIASTSDDGAWMDSGDVVRTDGDRVFFLGRANGSLNVGGNKVMPEEVESVIKELPEVTFVQVRARKSTLLGQLIEAAIIPRVDVALDAALKKKIIEHCRARLDAFKIPAFVVAMDRIHLTASGKLSRTIIE